MRLSRQKCLFPVLIASIACSSSTGPETVSAHFMLVAIDGRPLPTYIATTPGPSATIISSSLTLDKTGNAVVIEHRNEMLRGDVTDTTSYQYQLRGAKIDMARPIFCVAITTCPSLLSGTISPFGLSLVINAASIDPHIVFQYRSRFD
jgi:hypothetical protein